MSSKVLTEYKTMFEANAKSEGGPQLRLTLLDKLILDVIDEARAIAPSHVSFLITGFSAVPSIGALLRSAKFSSSEQHHSQWHRGNGNYVTRSGHTAVTLAAYTDTIQLSITDHGCGIPDDIYPAFSMKDSRRQAKGNGLGLSQAAKAIEINDGTINIRTQVGHGTTMTIALPREPAQNGTKRAFRFRPAENFSSSMMTRRFSLISRTVFSSSTMKSFGFHSCIAQDSANRTTHRFNLRAR